MLSPIIVIRLNLLHKFVSTIKHHLSRFSVRIIILLTCPPKTSPFFKLVVEWTWEDGKWLRKHLPRNRLSLSFGK